jgi:hypothetical protein
LQGIKFPFSWSFSSGLTSRFHGDSDLTSSSRFLTKDTTISPNIRLYLLPGIGTMMKISQKKAPRTFLTFQKRLCSSSRVLVEADEMIHTQAVYFTDA